jgi:EthD domain
MRTEVTDDLLALGAPGLVVNLRDEAVGNSLMTLTTLDPPFVGFVTIWTQQCYGPHVLGALARLESECARVDAYLVTESVPMAPPQTSPGERTHGLANVAVLRRPDGMDAETWFRRWHIDHTPVAFATQSTFAYTQNAVVRRLTAGAPAIDAIVEELFPIEAARDLHVFFDAADDAQLTDRMNQMVASTAAFGANENVDSVPTSRYVFRTPFTATVP